jgi:hypothetical protein
MLQMLNESVVLLFVLQADDADGATNQLGSKVDTHM